MNLETYRNHLRDKLAKNKSIRSDASINREMSCLHHIFTKAVEWEMIEENPFTEIKSSFTSALKRAEIVDFRFHDLRHTFASQVLMKGGSLKDVQELLGHKTMTLRYAHLTQEHKRKAINLLNGLTASKKSDGHKMVTNPFQEKSASL